MRALLCLLFFGLMLWGCDDNAGTSEGGGGDAMGGTPLSDGAIEMDAALDDGGGGRPSTARPMLNEVSPNPGEGADDWFELVIVGEGTVNLSAYTVVDDNPDHAPFTFPSMEVSAGDFVLVTANAETPAPGGIHFPYGLGRNDALALSSGGALVDTVAWNRDNVPDGATHGRLPDGQGPWTLNTPTPGASNQAGEFDAPDGPADAFPSDRVMEIRVEITPDAWQAILADPLAEEYHEANLIYDGERLDGIAIRVKGNSSLNSVARSPSTRFSFKIDTNRINAGQEMRGLQKFNLNNGFKDPSLMREHLAYGVYREFGLPAVRTAFADLYVGDLHMGLYTVVEAVDDEFLKRVYDNGNGDLYKPEPPSGQLQYRGDRIEDYPSIEPESNEDTTDHAAFLNFVRVLGREPVAMFGTVMNVDEILRYLAVTTVLVNLDSYLGMGHNFFLYEQDAVFDIIPWDLNEAFGNFTCGCDRDGLIHFRIDEPTCGPPAERPLVGNLLSDPAYLATYHDYLREVIEGPFSWATMEPRIRETAALIRPYVEADTTKFFSTEMFEQSLDEDVGAGRRSSVLGLGTFVRERTASVAEQLAGTRDAGGDGRGGCQGQRGGMNPGGGGMNPGGGGQHPCGDGRCDDYEQRNPTVCPRDCEDRPDDYEWCGDGNCDALERHEGSCPEDCQ